MGFCIFAFFMCMFYAHFLLEVLSAVFSTRFWVDRCPCSALFKNPFFGCLVILLFWRLLFRVCMRIFLCAFSVRSCFRCFVQPGFRLTGAHFRHFSKIHFYGFCLSLPFVGRSSCPLLGGLLVRIFYGLFLVTVIFR